MTRLRVATVGLRFDPARVATRETFARSLRGILERLDPLPPSVPTLVCLPEHTGLLAAFAGPRGATAREALAAGDDSVHALTALAVAYGEELGRYAERFPEVDAVGQLLHLALTDTVVHVLVETLAELAREHRAWVSVGAALPDWERVTGAAARAVTGSPSGRSTAYVAVSSHVRNRNLILAPDGALAAVQDKAYLVPMERDRAAGLGLDALPVDRLAVADLPIGRVASVISKDAWMVDVNDRLDQLGAQLLLQPEAFDRWGEVERDDLVDGEEVADLWPPDKFQRGGWWMVQRHPGFRANVTSVLLGDLGDLTFDGQPAIAVPAPHGDVRLGLLGQPADEGWAAIGPWWRDPRPAAELAVPGHRSRFAATAALAAPAGATVDDLLVCADLELPVGVGSAPATPRRPGLRPSVEVVGDGSLLVPDLALDATGTPVLVGVAGDGRGRQEVVASRWTDGGWSCPVAVAPAPPGAAVPFDRQWRPRLTSRGTALVCLHLAFPDESWDLFAVTDDGGRRGSGARWAPATRVDDAERASGVLRERGHDAPAIVAVDDGLVAVWSDLRWPWVLPQIRFARSRDGGRTWSASHRVDGGPTAGSTDPLAPRSPHETRGQTAPAIARTDAGPVVAWQERVPGAGPSIWLVHEDGDGWSSPCLLDPSPGPARWRPALAAAGRTAWLVDEVATDGGGRHLEVRTSTDAGRTWGPPAALDGGWPERTQRRAALVALEDAVAVVFEDDRSGTSRIHAAIVDADGRTDEIWRLDDAPEHASARAPAAVGYDGELLVAWQDARTELERVRSLVLPLPDRSET